MRIGLQLEGVAARPPEQEMQPISCRLQKVEQLYLYICILLIYISVSVFLYSMCWVCCLTWRIGPRPFVWPSQGYLHSFSSNWGEAREHLEVFNRKQEKQTRTEDSYGFTAKYFLMIMRTRIVQCNKTFPLATTICLVLAPYPILRYLLGVWRDFVPRDLAIYLVYWKTVSWSRSQSKLVFVTFGGHQYKCVLLYCNCKF